MGTVRILTLAAALASGACANPYNTADELLRLTPAELAKTHSSGVLAQVFETTQTIEGDLSTTYRRALSAARKCWQVEGYSLVEADPPEGTSGARIARRSSSRVEDVIHLTRAANNGGTHATLRSVGSDWQHRLIETWLRGTGDDCFPPEPEAARRARQQ